MRWINKFLRPRSPAKEYVDPLVCRTGNTVFVISWINPDARLRDKSLEHYMLEGAIAAMAAVEKATGERAVNCVGYCLGGTLLAVRLSLCCQRLTTWPE
jgi:polyhydroxyalkanoate synthase subunit PhaC